MVEVTVGGGGQLQGTEADVVQSLVVDAVGLVGVLHQLVHRQGGVVWLHNGVRHLQHIIVVITTTTTTIIITINIIIVVVVVVDIIIITAIIIIIITVMGS